MKKEKNKSEDAILINHQEKNGDYVSKLFVYGEFEQVKKFYEKLLWFNSLFPQEGAVEHNSNIYKDQIKHLDDVWNWLKSKQESEK